MKKTATKKPVKKQVRVRALKGPRRVMPDRVRVDARVSGELYTRLEAVAVSLGTTKNSVLAVGAMLFVDKLEKILGNSKAQKKEDVVKLALEGLFSE